MKILVRCLNLKPYKKNLIKADLEHTKWMVYDEVIKLMDKIKNDKNISFKFVRLLKKLSNMADITIDALVTRAELVAEMGIFVYQVKEQESSMEVHIDIADEYFELPKIIPFIGGILKVVLENKKSFLRKLEKSVKDWGVDYTIETNLK